MYSYNAYIHSRIHIFFYVSSLIIRSISVCCVRVVMRMCLLQHDTTQSRAHTLLTCASAFTYAVQGLYKFCNPAHTNIDLGNLIPGRIVNDSGNRKVENTLELFHGRFGGFPIITINQNCWDGRIVLCNTV